MAARQRRQVRRRLTIMSEAVNQKNVFLIYNIFARIFLFLRRIINKDRILLKSTHST